MKRTITAICALAILMAGAIPTDDFEWNGRLYRLLDMTRRDETCADTSLIPKTIQENGRTLELANVSWRTVPGGNDALNPTYTASVTYSGTAASKYATGYTVSAEYTGEVSKTGSDRITYTAIFGSVERPEESESPDMGGGEDQERGDAARLHTLWLAGGGAILILAGVCGKDKKGAEISEER